MFMQPLTFMPLLGLAAALVWGVFSPGPAPAIVAIALAAFMVWALHRGARARESALLARLAGVEERAREQREAARQSEAARARVEAELRATDERYRHSA